MDTCSCAPASLTCVTFARGIVMRRCPAHEVQSWTVDGSRTDAATARGLLKDVFVELRGQRVRSSSPAPTPRVLHLDVPSYDDDPSTEVALPAGADERLTALLNARGLQGSWATA
jgi:hypothetical protein